MPPFSKKNDSQFLRITATDEVHSGKMIEEQAYALVQVNLKALNNTEKQTAK